MRFDGADNGSRARGAQQPSRRLHEHSTSGSTANGAECPGSRVARILVSVLVASALMSAGPEPARAATARLRYSPFSATGSASPTLNVTPRFGGDCASASFIVRGEVFRCFDGNFIRDPCYFD